MRKITVVKTGPVFMERVNEEDPGIARNDYELRIELLVQRLERAKLDFAIVYGDWECFANIEYLTGYDPRYEQALLVLDAEGRATLVVGGEGWGYSFKVPVEIDRVLYQNFSPQGQSREKLVPLSRVFRNCGINQSSKIGLIGYKYFEKDHVKNPEKRHDVPSYIVEELYEVVDKTQVVNFTRVMTNPHDGIRVVVRTAREIAHYEHLCSLASTYIFNMLKSMKPGMTELELSAKAEADGTPIGMFPVVVFGTENMSLVFPSPGSRRLRLGEVAGLCQVLRGGSVTRYGAAAYDRNSYSDELQGSLEEFFMPFFRSNCLWYESVKLGADCGKIYRDVTTMLHSGKKMKVYLNAGHNTGQDEWVNSPFSEDSDVLIPNGYYLQSDLVGMTEKPLRFAIMEDGVVIADSALRADLANSFPRTAARIAKRTRFIKDVLGIGISEDLLPMSNLNCLYFPFMLDSTQVLSMK